MTIPSRPALRQAAKARYGLQDGPGCEVLPWCSYPAWPENELTGYGCGRSRPDIPVLRNRVPGRLVEYAWNIPWWMKQCDQVEKGILRRALRDVLPKDVLYRRKSPYPKTHNPSYLAAVRELLMELLEDRTSPLRPLLDINAVRQLTRLEGDAFDRPWYGQLMTGPQLFAYLIQVDTWLREYKVIIR